jgi:hypothetical protein
MDLVFRANGGAMTLTQAGMHLMLKQKLKYLQQQALKNRMTL